MRRQSRKGLAAHLRLERMNMDERIANLATRVNELRFEAARYSDFEAAHTLSEAYEVLNEVANGTVKTGIPAVNIDATAGGIEKEINDIRAMAEFIMQNEISGIELEPIAQMLNEFAELKNRIRWADLWMSR